MSASRWRLPGLIATAAVMLAGANGACAWDLSGIKHIALQTRDGQSIPIGTVVFEARDGRTGFTLHIDYARFQDFFLSMREFKCLAGAEEIQCYVPYPYANPSTVTPQDLRWLEHALLFMYKTPKEFGAPLRNGLYYHMAITDQGIVGTAQAIDLNQIAAPPDDPSSPPYGPADRSDIASGSRSIGTLTIR
jgi:hypothetical protein